MSWVPKKAQEGPGFGSHIENGDARIAESEPCEDEKSKGPTKKRLRGEEGSDALCLEKRFSSRCGTAHSGILVYVYYPQGP